MKTEAWLKRKIELKRQAVMIMAEEMGEVQAEVHELEQELARMQVRSLDCVPMTKEE